MNEIPYVREKKDIMYPCETCLCLSNYISEKSIIVFMLQHLHFYPVA